MTVQRLREQRIATPEVEERANMMSSYPNGWGFNNPAAIPPPGMYQLQRAGIPVTVHTSLQVDTVFTSLRVISNAIIKMGHARAYTEALTPDNEPYRVWQANQPSNLTCTFGPNVPFHLGQRQTVISMGLFGEAFWLTLVRYDAKSARLAGNPALVGYPQVIEVLHPAFVEVEVSKGGEPIYYYGSGVNKVQLPTEDVTWIPFMALPGASRGLGAIEYAGVSFALALAAMEYGQRWFAQGASPSYILSTEQKLGQEEVERIARKFLVEHSGLQSAHLPLVLDSGLKADKVSSTPDEAQYLNTLEYARSCVAAWFGLPPHLVGGANDRGNVWGKTIQEQGMQLVDFTISGYIVPLDHAYSSLLPDGMSAALDESYIQRADAENMSKLIVAERTGTVKTPNEIRVKDFKLKPVEGGDDLFTPLNSNTSPPVGTVLADELAKDTGQTPPPAAPPAGDGQ